MVVRIAVVAIFLSASASPLFAQPPGDDGDAVLHVGDRVRVTAPALGLRRVAGPLDALRADTLFVRGLGPIPRNAITRLDVSAGRRSAGNAALRGAGYGAAIGGGLGLVVLAIGVVSDQRDQCQDCFVTGTMAGAAALVAGLAGGTVAGGAIGLIIRPERWRPVSSPRTTAVPAPTPRRLQLGLALPFR